MAKKLDLSKPVYELVKQYPELTNIMVELGFKEIANPVMLNSVGRITTIPKGAKMHKISMMKVVTKLVASGFALEGKMPSFVFGGKKQEFAIEKPAGVSQERINQIKSFLQRLGEGEALDSVREDFVAQFSHVEASEIMLAEQALMKEGTPLEEVQKLCDIHSALFHGATREEKIMNAELEVEASLKRKEEGTDKTTQALVATAGHPLHTFSKENEAFEMRIPKIRALLANRAITADIVEELRQISVHYAKKGDLLYPHLKVKYDITGPSNVMWTVDDEIRNTLSTLAKQASFDESWYESFAATLTRAEEMLYKEKNILFPICATNFTNEEWFNIYEDAKDYANIFGVVPERWAEAESALAEKKKKSQEALLNGEIVMPGGHMTVEQLTAMLNTIPLEISFVDENNINRYFNEGPKVFKRAGMAIDRDVFSCHPPKIEPIVRSILDSFRNGTQDSVPVWMEKEGRTMLVTYMAVRDKNKNYLGTMELVQDMEFAKEHFAK